MNKANARAAANAVAEEYRKCKGRTVESNYAVAMMVHVLVVAGIDIRVICEPKGDYGVKTTAVIVDGERVEV